MGNKIKVTVSDLCEVVERQHKMPITDRKLDLPIYVELDVSEAIRLVDGFVILAKQGIKIAQAEHKSFRVMNSFVVSLVKELDERGIRFTGVK